MKKIIVNPYQSPCGVLLLGSIGDKLCLCDWRTEKHSARVDNRLKRMWNAEFEEGTSAVIESARQQLDEYFAGKRQTFDIPLLFIGTDFQKTEFIAYRTKQQHAAGRLIGIDYDFILIFHTAEIG